VEPKDKTTKLINMPHNKIEAAIQLIPYVGGSLATLYFGSKHEKRFQRIVTFYEELSKEVEVMKEEIARIEDYDPDEMAAILEALNENIEAEALETKRKHYKQYFKNTLRRPVNGNYDERKMFLDLITILNPIQFEIIGILVQQTTPINSGHLIKDGIEPSLITGSIELLSNYGIIKKEFEGMVLGGPGGGIHESFKLSQFGARFCQFCMQED